MQSLLFFVFMLSQSAYGALVPMLQHNQRVIELSEGGNALSKKLSSNLIVLDLKALGALQVSQKMVVFIDALSAEFLTNHLLRSGRAIMSGRIFRQTQRCQTCASEMAELDQSERDFQKSLDSLLTEKERVALQDLFPSLVKAVLKTRRSVRHDLVSSHMLASNETFREASYMLEMSYEVVLYDYAVYALKKLIARVDPKVNQKLDEDFLIAQALLSIGRYLRQPIIIGCTLFSS